MCACCLFFLKGFIRRSVQSQMGEGWSSSQKVKHKRSKTRGIILLLIDLFLKHYFKKHVTKLWVELHTLVKVRHPQVLLYYGICVVSEEEVWIVMEIGESLLKQIKNPVRSPVFVWWEGGWMGSMRCVCVLSACCVFCVSMLWAFVCGVCCVRCGMWSMYNVFDNGMGETIVWHIK